MLPCNFADKLLERIEKTGSSLDIGIDPDPKGYMARHRHFAMATHTLYPASRCWTHSARLSVDAAPLRLAVKPQAAFFEAAGTWGYASLSRCMKLARQKGIPVILDAKRGDIGNTAAAYAAAYLDPASEFFAGRP